jgi:Lon protease-like protein
VSTEPTIVAMFPLSAVLFPSAELPLHVFEPRYRALIEDVMAGDGNFGTVLIAAGSEVGGGDQRCGTGTLAHVEMVLPFEDGRSLLISRGVERLRVVEWLSDDPYPRAVIETLAPAEPADLELLAKAAAAVRRVRMLLSEFDDGPCCPIEIDLSGDVSIDAWMVCALAPLGLFDAQQLLETEATDERLRRLVELCCAKITDLELLLSRPGP